MSKEEKDLLKTTDEVIEEVEFDECDYLGFDSEEGCEGASEEFEAELIACGAYEDDIAVGAGYDTDNGLHINVKLSKVNFTNKTSRTPLYLVYHYVGAVSSAYANAVYFYDVNRGASAHLFVDETQIWQVVEYTDVSWHCGGGRQSNYGGAFFKKCTNSNSIGIELCCKKDSKGNWYIEPETLKRAAKLGQYLMKRFNIPANRVIRHYDVTGKFCPQPLLDDKTWSNYKNTIIKGDELDVTQYEELKNMISGIATDVANIKKRMGMEYAWVDKNMPEYARSTITKLMQKGHLRGDSEGKLNLDTNMLRMFVILDRAGLFDDDKLAASICASVNEIYAQDIIDNVEKSNESSED